MKRFFCITAVLTLLFPLCLGAQQKVSTKKFKIADLNSRTTKVVLTGNDLTDTSLKQEVSSRWRISPYEFCSAEEYNALKKNPDTYFLLLARSEEKKYRGILTLTLMKGGDPASDDQRKRPVDVASLPVCASGWPSGREITFMAAFLDILQDYVSRAMESDKVAYKGFDIYSGKARRCAHKNIFFADSDIVPDIGEPLFVRQHFDGDMVICDEAQADREFSQGAYNTLVSYTVAPFDPEEGDFCYKMLIDAGSHELCYWSHHRIGESKWAGFLTKDVKKISSQRKSAGK